MTQVAVVTGASSGLGEAIARELSRQGYAVVLAARRADLLQKTAGEIQAQGGEALVVPTDLTRREEVAALAQRALGWYGRVDVLVNNAGVGSDHWTWQVSDREIDWILTTDLLAPIWLTRDILPIMRQQHSGAIFNIGSVSGHIATPGSSLYAAAKFGLRGYTQALRREVRRSGIHVTLISPGFIRTAMTRGRRGVPMPGPEVVARAVVQALQHPRREIVVPGWYRPLMWLERRFPGLADRVTSWVMRPRYE